MDMLSVPESHMRIRGCGESIPIVRKIVRVVPSMRKRSPMNLAPTLSRSKKKRCSSSIVLAR